MQWGQIKTLLIASFLILNIYLFIQFMEKKEEADIGILEQHTSSIEEQLRDDGITYGELPDEEYEETFISVEQYEFTEEELKKERKTKDQRSEEHTSELQSRGHLVCRLLLEIIKINLIRRKY